MKQWNNAKALKKQKFTIGGDVGAGKGTEVPNIVIDEGDIPREGWKGLTRKEMYGSGSKEGQQIRITAKEALNFLRPA